MIRRVLKKIIPERWRIKYRLIRYLQYCSQPLLIYQMGKVGSMSIYETLRAQGLQPVHLHGLSLQYARCLNRKKHVRIITLIREPIGRNISEFFQHSTRFTGIPYYQSIFSIDEWYRIFLEVYPHTNTFTWFDRQMYKRLGIDVYQFPFPVQTGYQVFTSGHYEVLILKLESTDQIKEQALSQFLHLERCRLIRANSAEEKEYAATYQEFLRTIRLPTEYIEMMVTARYTRHFYSDSEIDAIRARWQR